MAYPSKEQRDKKIKLETDKLNGSLRKLHLTRSLAENMGIFKQLFERNQTVLFHTFENRHDPSVTFGLMYSAGMVDGRSIDESIIEPLMLRELGGKALTAQAVAQSIILSYNPRYESDLQAIVSAAMYGDAVVFIEGCAEVLLIGVQNFPQRSIAEPESEKTLSGPKEGFNEVLMSNLTQLKRRLRTFELKIEMLSLGRLSQTQLAIVYLDCVAKDNVLQELKRRLKGIDIDGLLDSNYLNELIRDNSRSPFRSTGFTERPDVAVGKLLQGGIAILLDGTPVTLTVPYLFIDNFHSSEDYYVHPIYASFTRFIRILGFFLTILVPSLAIAIIAFHHEILPTPLLVSISQERQNVPLPIVLEAVLMLTVFDILRETGVRTPTSGSQALSIVGALVVGQAAVEAKLVSSTIIIVVALTGITNLLIPKTPGAAIIIRYGLLIMASIMGLPGIILGFSVVVIHILTLTSFGIPQISAEGNWSFQRIKDSIIRAPIGKMITRPPGVTDNRIRIKTEQDGGSGQ